MKLFGRVILPILLFIYIAIETYAKLNHTSICGTTGCELAGELLRFDSIYLNYFGGMGALIISVFGFLSIKEKSFEKLFFVILLSAIVFESIMIAYQLIANPEPCIFCIGVYSGLLLIGLFSNWRYLLLTIPVIVALFISMNSLSMTVNRSITGVDGNYLIGSKTCPHCKKVKEYFAEQNIPYTNIAVRKDVNARFFIKQLGINTIPVLIIKEKNRSTILKGDIEIIEYFDNKRNPDNVSSTKGNSESTDILNASSDGCSASVVTETADCSEDSGVPLR